MTHGAELAFVFPSSDWRDSDGELTEPQQLADIGTRRSLHCTSGSKFLGVLSTHVLGLFLVASSGVIFLLLCSREMLCHAVVAYWTNFAKTGDPNGVTDLGQQLVSSAAQSALVLVMDRPFF